ncbi:hypothetical protein KFE25_004629 [Diacronema lutheri]|uniref:malate dehydrogenase n=1 Tax=Diacronema lutheri TaxID=2081491 RepID=A0A8J6CCN4_DIALT|nr:hypothetical protein KFE25_004629 [Diacronema lutheri]
MSLLRRAAPKPAVATATRRFASFSPKELEAYRGKIAADLTGLSAAARASLDAKAKLLEWDTPAASYSAVTFPKPPAPGASKEVRAAYTECMVAEQAWLDEKLSAAKAHLTKLLASKVPNGPETARRMASFSDPECAQVQQYIAQLEHDSGLAHKFDIAKWKPPVTVAVTGAAGAIGYSLLFKIASGEMLGPDQPVVLSLLDLPTSMDKVQGVMMELADCAFPLLHGMGGFSDARAAFEGVDYACLVGATPRGPGMERKDLLLKNAEIFAAQGKALNAGAPGAKVVVVGNPANTNCLIGMMNAPDMPRANWTAMTRLDQTRAEGLLAAKAGVSVNAVDRVVIWGNHSATQFPDISHATVGGKWAKEAIPDEWYKSTFIPEVAQRGAAIIKARGASSAASAAQAAVFHVRDWALGSRGKWASMGVISNGSYGIGEDLVYSVPVVCYPGEYRRVGGISIDPYAAQMMEATRKELIAERDAIKHLLPK